MSDPAGAAAGGDDSDLLAAVRAGDAVAFRALYRRETPGMYRLALQVVGGSGDEAEDVVQEAWHRALRGLPSFEGRSSLTTWLRAIVVRCALEVRRIRGRDGPPSPDREAAEPCADADRPATRMDLERAFERLPAGFRAVLVLHDVEGYRHRDIAELLGISAGTSKSQLSRARVRLREALGDDYVRE